MSTIRNLDYDGAECVCVESANLRVIVAPSVGGKVVGITHLPSGHEFLWRDDKRVLKRQQAGTEYDSNFFGGIDELLPNDLPENICGIDLPDHGELWTTPFNYKIEDEKLALWGILPLSGLEYCRTMSLSDHEPRIDFRYQIRNTQEKPFPLLWKLHAALQIAEGDRIICPAEKAKVADLEYSRWQSNEPFNWPNIEGARADVVPPVSNQMDFLYLYELHQGRMGLANQSSGMCFEYRFDPEVFPVCWLFASYGGFNNSYTAILEPCTTMPMSVNEASSSGVTAVLQPGETLETEVSIHAGPVTKSKKGIKQFLSCLILQAVAFLLCQATLAAGPDIMVADFEGPDYGKWTTAGEAFDAGPAHGTLLGQMEVVGFEGKGLVNSFRKGDGSTGTLTSEPMIIKRKNINFLIGGGGYAGETCINLLVNDKVVRTATGPNTMPGGSERLAWHTWNVADLIGKTAVIQIVDKHTGSSGHINVDQIVQSDDSFEVTASKYEREIALEKNYLNLPVKNGAPTKRMELIVDGKTVRAFDIELASGKPDWWAHIDISPFRGKTAVLTVDLLGNGERGLELVDQSNTLKNAENLYNEPLRPQFHFNQKRGWNNDPNGMVYYNGEYHLFYQYNPYGCGWGNLHWGHAVSEDLVHWEELPIALFPWTQAAGHCFSGSAVVDKKNTAGFQTGEEKPIVAIFSDTGTGAALAYSNDRGRTFTYYKNNPVIAHPNAFYRDPKVFWYAPGKCWVLAQYEEKPFEGSRKPEHETIAFYTSPNLKDWTRQSQIEGYFECPEIFELPVDGNIKNTRWVLFAANGRYALGQFDGKQFTLEHVGKHQVHWGSFYASQTFNNVPDGRRIQIGWGMIKMPGMSFNQMMAFPCQLTLRTTEDGIRMFAKPVEEIELLHGKDSFVVDRIVTPETSVNVTTSGRLFDIRADFKLDDAKAFGLKIGDTEILYDIAQEKLMDMPLKPIDGKIQLQVLVDRSSLEVCGNDGRVYKTMPFMHKNSIDSIHVFSIGGSTKLKSLKVWQLRSARPE